MAACSARRRCNVGLPDVTYRMVVSDARTGKTRTLRFVTSEQDPDEAVKRVEQSQRVTVLNVEVEDAKA